MPGPVRYDISIPLSVDTPPWPGDTAFSCGWTCRRESHASVNLGALSFSAHVGTHADAPLHVESGWGASETLPLDAFVGDSLVLDWDATRAVDGVLTQGILSTLLGDRWAPRLLWRTGYSVASGAFPASWPTLDPDAIPWLLARGLRLWGTDAPSVDARHSQDLPVHHALFGGGAWVLENLDLRAVPPGRYELLAQPVAVTGADAAPVRALLREPLSPV